MSTLLWAGLALASEGGAHGEAETHGIPWGTLIITGLNLVIFLGLLGWLARRPLADALANRASTVRKSLDEAARLQDEAQARFSEVESRLVALDRRIEELKREAEADAAREEVRLHERAEQDARRIRDTAERTIREEAESARQVLRGEASVLAVQLAREIVRRNLTADDQERLARQFLAAVDKEPAHD